MMGIHNNPKDLSRAFSHTGDMFIKASVWGVRTVKAGCNKLAFAVQTIWNGTVNLLKSSALVVLNFFRSPAGFALSTGLIAVILGVSAETVDKKWAAIALRVGAAVFFVAAGVALGIGLAVGFSTPII